MTIAAETFSIVKTEILQPAITVTPILESQFIKLQPSLARLQALTYARYTEDGNPVEIDSHHAHPPDNVVYLTAQIEDLPQFFVPPKKDHLKFFEQELRSYQKVAGFFRVEWGETSVGKDPIEAMKLMKWSEWPRDNIVGYVASLTINPLLPKEIKMRIQTALHLNMYGISRQHGFENNIFTILQSSVLQFVEESGLSAQKLEGAVPNKEDPDVRKLMETFPKYWQCDPPPQLYRFIPK
jgi:hypothetical protein